MLYFYDFYKVDMICIYIYISLRALLKLRALVASKQKRDVFLTRMLSIPANTGMIRIFMSTITRLGGKMS